MSKIIIPHEASIPPEVGEYGYHVAPKKLRLVQTDSHYLTKTDKYKDDTNQLLSCHYSLKTNIIPTPPFISNQGKIISIEKQISNNFNMINMKQ